MLQIAEAAEAGPEVVERQTAAQGPDPLGELATDSDPPQQCGLGHLDDQQRGVGHGLRDRGGQLGDDQRIPDRAG